MGFYYIGVYYIGLYYMGLYYIGPHYTGTLLYGALFVCFCFWSLLLMDVVGMVGIVDVRNLTWTKGSPYRKQSGTSCTSERSRRHVIVGFPIWETTCAHNDFGTKERSISSQAKLEGWETSDRPTQKHRKRTHYDAKADESRINNSLLSPSEKHVSQILGTQQV